MGVSDSLNGNEVVLGGGCGPNTVWNSGLNQCVMAGPGFEPGGSVGVGPYPPGEGGPVGFGGVGQ